MAKEIKMPRLSETMVDGKVLTWYKKPNDTVNKGDVIAEIETDKANMEVEAIDSGVLSEILVGAGQKAKVGEAIAVLNGSAPSKKEAPEQVPKQEMIEEEKEEPEKESPAQPQKQTVQKYSGNVKASSGAKALALKENVDLSQVKGTGPGERIRENDVLEYLQQGKKKEPVEPQESGRNVEVKSLSKMRETIANRMTYSKQNIPHFYVTYEVNADPLIEFHKRLSEKVEGLTYNDIIIKATAMALKKHPEFNSSFKGDHIEIIKDINVGIAFAVEEGLLVPVVRDADKKSLKEISDTTKSIKDKIKNNKLKPEDMTGGTFSISNMGMYGVKSFSAIINPPEAAGLAVGAIMRMPVIRDDNVAIGNTVNLTISADHRVVDGAEAALFLKDLKELLENPEKLNGNA